MDGCLFCRIAAGELGTPLLYEDSAVVAFADMHPQAPAHALVIPRRHVASLADAADADLLGKVLAGARSCAQRLGLSSYRTVINTGADAGQSVFHLHLHVLGGRSFGWPPG